ncbi:MAG: hypothetical protein SFU98_02490 [Leptospiraceae bacterium]|nr:hypothetical protein [Leptospiraceae bacterium]
MKNKNFIYILFILLFEDCISKQITEKKSLSFFILSEDQILLDASLKDTKEKIICQKYNIYPEIETHFNERIKKYVTKTECKGKLGYLFKLHDAIFRETLLEAKEDLQDAVKIFTFMKELGGNYTEDKSDLQKDCGIINSRLELGYIDDQVVNEKEKKFKATIVIRFPLKGNFINEESFWINSSSRSNVQIYFNPIRISRNKFKLSNPFAEVIAIKKGRLLTLSIVKDNKFNMKEIQENNWYQKNDDGECRYEAAEDYTKKISY